MEIVYLITLQQQWSQVSLGYFEFLLFLLLLLAFDKV